MAAKPSSETPSVSTCPSEQETTDLVRQQEFRRLTVLLKKSGKLNTEDRKSLSDLIAHFTLPKPQDLFIARLESLGLNDETAKVDGARREVRLMAVSYWLVHGWSTGRICQEAARRWKGSERQTKRYVSNAWKLMQADLNRDRSTVEARVIAYMERSYEMAVEQRSPDVMLRTAEAMSRVFGLNRTVKQVVEVSGPNGGPMAFFDVPDKE